MLTRSPIPARSPSASPSSFHTSFHYAPSSPQKRSPKLPTAVSRRPSTSSPLGLSKSAVPSTSSSTSTSTIPPQPQPQPQPPPPSVTAIQSSSPSRSRAQAPAAHPEQTSNYVGVDAATQYSPMEPYQYFVPRDAQAKPTLPAPQLKPLMPGTIAAQQQQLQQQPQQQQQQQQQQKAATNHHAIASSTATQPDALQAARATTQSPNPTEQPPMLRAPHPLSPNKRRISEGPDAVVGEASGTGPVAQGLPKRAKPDVIPPKVLPVRYELCAIEDVVVLIANMLSELIETNDALAMRAGHLTRFHSRTAPGISVLDYLHRIAKHATLTPPLLLSMVYYIDRLCALYPDFTINTLTVHRFLITAATVAAKGLSDCFWSDSTYARVGGVKMAELKLLELEFLHRVDWKIVPNHEVLVAYYRGLVQRSPAYVLDDEVLGQEDAAADESEDTEISSVDVDEEDDAEEASEGREPSTRGRPPDAAAPASVA